jgi:hypothetical protein
MDWLRLYDSDNMVRTSRILSIIMVAISVIPMKAQSYPQTDLSNGLLRAKVYLPDIKRGYYRGTRFDWSGVIASLDYKGHSYFGPFFQKFNPDLPDIELGEEVVAGANGAASGPVEEFMSPDGTSLGYLDAKGGDGFCKIGVGILQKPQEPNYSSFQNYKILSSGTWTVRSGGDWIEFVQEVDCGSGYSYVYRKTVRLARNKPEMILEHRLTNTGRKVIETSVYDHNFLVMDQQAPGPDFAVTFPFVPKATANLDGFAEIRGHRLVLLKTLKNDDVFYSPLEGFNGGAKDYKITVENHKTGAGVQISGDQPLAKMVFWSIRTVLAPEAFISMRIEPGRSHKWKYRYRFYTVAPESGR